MMGATGLVVPAKAGICKRVWQYYNEEKYEKPPDDCSAMSKTIE